MHSELEMVDWLGVVMSPLERRLWLGLLAEEAAERERERILGLVRRWHGSALPGVLAAEVFLWREYGMARTDMEYEREVSWIRRLLPTLQAGDVAPAVKNAVRSFAGRLLACMPGATEERRWLVDLREAAMGAADGEGAREPQRWGVVVEDVPAGALLRFRRLAAGVRGGDYVVSIEAVSAAVLVRTGATSGHGGAWKNGRWVRLATGVSVVVERGAAVRLDTDVGRVVLVSESQRVSQALSLKRSPCYGVPRWPEGAFVGREDDLSRVEGMLGAGPVAVSGLAGVGKTELALQLAYQLAGTDRYPGGIFWLDAATPALTATWGGSIADQLGVPTGPTDERARLALGMIERHGQALVILDNVVEWTPAERPAPLPRGPNVHLLVTTQQWNLGGPNAFQHLELAFLSPAAARTLLTTLSGRDEPDFDALVAYLGGHTLAIDLAGAYLATYPATTAATYLSRLQAGADLTANDTPQVAYARTVEQALSAIWERLDGPTRRAWRVAGVFAPAEATLDLLTACGVDEDAQRALRQHHLIATTATSWTMHRLVRAYGERAGTDDERTAAQRQFVEAAVALAKGIDLDTGFRLYRDNLPQLDHAIDLAGTALAMAPDAHSWLLDRVGTGAQSAGDLPRAKELLERALASALQNLGEDHPSVATRRSNLALVLKDLGDLLRAKELLERALASAIQHLGEDHPSVATGRSNLALVLKDLGDLPGAKALLERALARDLHNLGENHPSVARSRANLALVLKDLGDLPRAKELLERALASALQNLGEDHPRVARSRNDLATVLQDLGDLRRAKDLLERALTSDLRALGDGHPSVARSRANLALVLKDLGDLPRAKDLLERALASDLQNLGEDHPDVAACRSHLAGVLQGLGDLPRAKDLLERALASDLQNLGEDHPSVATRRSNLAGVLQDLGDLPRAKELLERALASDLQNLGEDHPSVATRRSNLATVHRALGDLPRAKELLERALASDLQNLGEDHPSVATRRSNLAGVLQDLGDLPRAKELHERALASDLQNLGEDHPSVATSRSNLALVLQGLGDLPRAKELLERALASDLQNLGEDHPSVANCRSNLALVLQALGDLPRAKELLERALASALQNLGEDHPSVATRRTNLALVLQALGDLPRAKELLERALASDLQNLGEDHPRVATNRSNLAGVLTDLGVLPRAKELLEHAIDAARKKLGDDHPNVITYRMNLAEVVKRMNAAAAAAAVRTESKEPRMTETHDVFICHASEDKARFVEPLLAALVGHGLTVWYDRFEIGLGDDVRAKMNEGLRGSRFGVVLVSPSSSKFWPQAELERAVQSGGAGDGGAAADLAGALRPLGRRADGAGSAAGGAAIDRLGRR
jgi:tetratricopeptide (TPR) repeat protein